MYWKVGVECITWLCLLPSKHELQLIHQTKPFPGVDNPGGGKVSFKDWLEVVKHVLEPDKPLMDHKKLLVLKKCLVKHAVQWLLTYYPMIKAKFMQKRGGVKCVISASLP